MTGISPDPRAELIRLSREAIARQLSNATAGNMSIRTETGMLITPSGIEPGQMSPDQIVEMTLEGTARGDWKPSSEWGLHAAIYRRRPEAQAVVHCHPMHGTALSAQRQPIPAFHYMVGGLGGTCVPCAPYRTFGTPELAGIVAETLGDRFHACLMANHGTISLGGSLAQAFARTELIETLSQQYLLALSAGQPLVLLSDAEMAEVRATAQKLGYGAPRRTDGAPS